jgi:hypothetical protein
MDEGGSRNGASLSEEGQCGGLRDWGLWKIRKAPDKGISLHRGSLTSEGNLESGRGLIHRGI